MAPGGAETFLFEMLRHLDRSKFDPTVLTIYGGGVLKEEFERINVKTMTMAFRNLVDVKEHIKLQRFMRAKQYDIVHTKLFHADMVGRLGALMTGVPNIISTVENQHEWEKPETARQRLKEWVYERSSRVNSKVVAVSQAIKDALVRRVGIAAEKIEVIPNGVDIDVFDPEKADVGIGKEVGIPASSFVIGAIGTLNENKNHEMLLEAAQAVRRKRSDVHFLIVGRGDQTKLRQMANQLNIDDRVHFLGVRRDIPRVLKSLDVYVMTSLSEGISMSLLEAMAMQRAVIATRVGGNAEIISDSETGILVPPRESDVLAQRIMELLARPQWSGNLGARARAHVIKQYNLRSIVERYSDLYEAEHRARSK